MQEDVTWVRPDKSSFLITNASGSVGIIDPPELDAWTIWWCNMIIIMKFYRKSLDKMLSQPDLWLALIPQLFHQSHDWAWRTPESLLLILPLWPIWCWYTCSAAFLEVNVTNPNHLLVPSARRFTCMISWCCIVVMITFFQAIWRSGPCFMWSGHSTCILTTELFRSKS